MYIYTDELCQTLIDCTHTSLSDNVQLCDTNQLETLARDLIFSIYVKRGQILATHGPVKQRRQRATQPQPHLQTLTTSAEKAPAKGGCPYQTRPDAPMKIL